MSCTRLTSLSCSTFDFSDGKYHMLPSGELLIRNVDESDKYRTYQCRAVNRLTGNTLLSVGRARFMVTGKWV
ncbi:hypothetical protein J437_LFUL006804 [Ladona fulva]|uniref:Uncharacterized protein n=1 Tax=Ladona fulva TaxID=123851 RepID=A0A8K0K5M2_LADFU|nr:hypothetical protein J437_LFUL006804 [Ladona fulva]